MTAPLTLPYITPPDVQLTRDERAIETLISVFCDLDLYGDRDLDRPLDVIRAAFRPDLTFAEITEHVTLICRLSGEVASWRDQLGRRDGESPAAAYEIAKNAYVAALERLATRPSTLRADTDQALSIVAERPMWVVR